MNPNDIAGQAQANWFRQANAQANSPVSGYTNPTPPAPTWLSQLPQAPSVSAPVGGLFDQPVGMPTMPQLGGLMDFNSLAFQLAGPASQSQMSPMNFMPSLSQFLFPSRFSRGQTPTANIGVRG